MRTTVEWAVHSALRCTGDALIATPLVSIMLHSIYLTRTLAAVVRNLYFFTYVSIKFLEDLQDLFLNCSGRGYEMMRNDGQNFLTSSDEKRIIGRSGAI